MAVFAASGALAAGRKNLDWLGVIVLFYSGLQKLLYGTYFRGQFLAFTVAQIDTFRKAMGFLLPAGELARLRSLSPLDPASAYRTSAPLFRNPSVSFSCAASSFAVGTAVFAPGKRWECTTPLMLPASWEDSAGMWQSAHCCGFGG